MAHQDLCFTYMLFIAKNQQNVQFEKTANICHCTKKKSFLFNGILIFVQLFRINQKKIVYLPI